MRLKLRSIAADMIPRGTRTDKDVHFYLNAGITIYATECHAVNLAVMKAAERRAAHPTEAETPSRR